MIHRMLRFPSRWEWHMLHQQRLATEGLSRRNRTRTPAAPAPRRSRRSAPGLNRPDADLSLSSLPLEDDRDSASSFAEFKRAHPELRRWLEKAGQHEHNYIQVSELPGGSPVMYGTLLFQASEDQRDIAKLHYWVTQEKLVTLHSDMRLSIQLQSEPWQDKLERCHTAPEAFFIVLSCVLEQMHAGLDRFESSLGELEQAMHVHNQSGIMNLIFDRRYDLLHWNHLFLPIQEIQGAAKEAFLELLPDSAEYQRLAHKLDRIGALLAHYAMEIDTLLAMDDAISSFRGNDIMKTLTIFTALFMPATVAGAFWGMNFNLLPWTHEPWGFAVISLSVLLITAVIYWWLWHKGWTGDLLKSHRAKRKQKRKRSSSSARKKTKFRRDKPVG
ncbi:magnesium transporter CorA family protein [Paenibacillus sp. GCM10027626]|uniref:magnesium transporter CorA family protein n=1 Tax=Paenibacillus sp. GCM10027626 TaxID=3273411 RepID=UPI0036411637